MITPEFVQMMARYNRWQNAQLSDCLSTLSTEELVKDRGAFFGSILGTLSHLWWGDGMWLARFENTEGPGGGIAHSTDLFLTQADWWAERVSMDDRFEAWANRLSEADLQGDFTWFSGATGQDQSKPMALLVVHVFNHQTHHRGQVHKMITEAGAKAPVSDLAFLPEE